MGLISRILIAFGLVIVAIFSLRLCLLPVSESQKSLSQLSSMQASASADVPDFDEIIDVTEKKQAFFDFLRPIVKRQNSIIATERQFLETLAENLDNGHSPSQADIYKFNKLAQKYQLELRTLDATALHRMLRRVDVVPEAMVLIQAANESGWGSSRFAREGRNFFGQWCYTKGCGLVPESRSGGMSHEVKVFKTVESSVSSYMRNLNSNGAYAMFRAIRADQRAQGRTPNAEDLIYGLVNYSERQDAYIEELLQMLRHNQKYLVENNEQSSAV
ncbi:glucosaminidase domain-containing protein [Shewanella cyperi]|uniref:Glucosaminidase domain-containing protein n=1 Tax=Shewanella cyperi TaxID=2814292 RepID=A0A974XNH1_9GAMM|nr:glucosaminidase domain-containing protein [Shewanella cyperi]QSX31657.1 glucosaminidase domain-containing protein [Shewanella cyperi]